jgi:hypothetical protein
MIGSTAPMQKLSQPLTIVSRGFAMRWVDYSVATLSVDSLPLSLRRQINGLNQASHEGAAQGFLRGQVPSAIGAAADLFGVNSRALDQLGETALFEA